MFMDNLKNTILQEKTLTENGAIAYKSTGEHLLDMHFKITSYRNTSEEIIEKDFEKLFLEDKETAIKWLFYVRDIRGGLGERRLFRVCMSLILALYTSETLHLCEHIAEFGRYDDLIYIMDKVDKDEVKNHILSIVRNQLKEDMENVKQNKPISLLAKWMPSINTSSKETIKKAKYIAGHLKIEDIVYQKMLSKLRKYLKVVEVDMSARKWSEIDYSSVPSKANLNYNNAFLRNDVERRKEFLESLSKGESKINSSVNYPYEIINKYCNNNGCYRIKNKNETFEAMWKSLNRKEISNTLVVADGSGSMDCRISNKTNATALTVANSLAIYFSEINKGQFANKYITFSTNPQFVDFSKCKSLQEKYNLALNHCEISDTNIEKTFNIILESAINNKVNQEDMPKQILILSDMQFNNATSESRNFDTLFENIGERYRRNGYELPKLIFWNLCAYDDSKVPIQNNKNGLTFMSGFSQNLIDMIISEEINPLKNLLSIINSPRYSSITL